MLISEPLMEYKYFVLEGMSEKTYARIAQQICKFYFDFQNFRGVAGEEVEWGDI